VIPMPIPELLLATTSGGISIGVGLWLARAIGRGGSWLMVFVTGRQDKREEHLDAANQRLYERMEAQIKGLTQRVDATERELRHCTEQHAEARAEVMELRAMMQGMGGAREHAALIVASEKKDAKA